MPFQFVLAGDGPDRHHLEAMMKELGIAEIIPAMCHLDYAMSEAGGTTEFVRQYTLASGSPYCDCGYKKLRR